MKHFLQTDARQTFTYCKPLICSPGEPPRELSRLDTKNWTPTPPMVEERLRQSLLSLAPQVDAIILMDQVDTPETGVITAQMRETIGHIVRERPALLVSADSRRSLQGFPPVIFKMNAVELAALTDAPAILDLPIIEQATLALARMNQRLVFVTLAERGIIGASPPGTVEHVPAFPVCGEIDIVGAGDAVTANLMSALAAGAGLREALELASAAASVVIHQLGTTGTASVSQLCGMLCGSR